MKKKWIAAILAMVCLLGACNRGDGVLPPSTDSSIDSSIDSSTGADESVSGSDSSSGGGSDGGLGGGSGTENDDCVDADDNGICDDCKQSVLITLDIYAVNDLHGKVLDNDSQEGVDELSTYLQNARAQNEYTVVLSSGDMWQGMAESNLTYGKLVTDWMNGMDFVSMTLGNHEYDWGEQYIRENAAMAEFPFLAINVYSTITNQRVDYCQPSVMVEINGVKVGIIGAMGDCYSSISSDKVQDVYFKTGSQLTELVKAESNQLRQAGADCIIYSLHDDYSMYDLSLSNGYVDVVFEGHSHQSYIEKDSYGVYHLQGGGDNKGITRASLEVNFARNNTKTKQANTISTSTYRYLDDHPIVAQLTEKYNDVITLARKELGQNDSYRGSWELCEKIAELYYRAGMEKWGDQYDIVLGGGYLKARSPYEIYAGKVTYGDLYNIFPFDNPIVLCKISGSKLRSQFLETSNSNYHIYCGDYGESIKNNIVNSKTYYIVIDTYSSLYSYNGATEIARYDETTYARDLLAEFIESGGYTANSGNNGNTGDNDNTGNNDNENTGNGENENTGNDNQNVALTPLSEILQMSNTLDAGEVTITYYYVKGTIKETPNPKYGNCTLVDEFGNEIWVYGILDSLGNRYENSTFNGQKPTQGDTVILYAPVMRYVNEKTGEDKLELYQAELIQIVNE